MTGAEPKGAEFLDDSNLLGHEQDGGGDIGCHLDGANGLRIGGGKGERHVQGFDIVGQGIGDHGEFKGNAVAFVDADDASQGLGGGVGGF